MNNNTFLKILEHTGEHAVINCKYIVDVHHGFTPSSDPTKQKGCVVIEMVNNSVYYTFGNLFEIGNEIERILGQYEQVKIFGANNE